MTKEERAEREAQARELFAQGKSVNEVAKLCFNNYWKAAKAVKDAIDGVTTKAAKKKGGERARKIVAEAEEPIENWDLTLQVPEDRLDDAFAAFTVAEKAQAIQTLLQARVDALFEVGS